MGAGPKRMTMHRVKIGDLWFAGTTTNRVYGTRASLRAGERLSRMWLHTTRQTARGLAADAKCEIRRQGAIPLAIL